MDFSLSHFYGSADFQGTHRPSGPSWVVPGKCSRDPYPIELMATRNPVERFHTRLRLVVEIPILYRVLYIWDF